jgi:hypothetical protein
MSKANASQLATVGKANSNLQGTLRGSLQQL